MKIVIDATDKDEPARIYPFVSQDADPPATTEQIIVWPGGQGQIWVKMHSNVMDWQTAQLWGQALLRAKSMARDGWK